MPPILTVTDEGVQPLPLNDLQLSIFDILIQIFGIDLSAAPQTPQLQITAAFAVAAVEISDAIVSVANGLDPNTAIGAQLASLGKLYDIEPFDAERSTVTATLTGVAGTGVLAGSLARTTTGHQFETLTDAVLSPAGVQVEMQAVETGQVEAAAGTLTEIVTVVPGWETITNAAAAQVGRAAQTDPSFRDSMFTRTARYATGSIAAIEAALADADAGKLRAYENVESTAQTIQGWTLPAHGILVVAERATDLTVRRAVETRRGMGVPTLTGIQGGTPDDAALNTVTDGTVTWRGQAHTGLNLSAASTPAAKAAALTTLLAGTGVTVRYDTDHYVAQFPWQPDQTQQFGTGTTEEAYGLNPDDATPTPGPFVRTRTRNLTVTVAVTRDSLFPADGLQRIRTGIMTAVDSYGVGAQVWANDLLTAAESVIGARVTSLSVQYNSTDVSGVSPPADVIWALPLANLNIAVT